MSDEYQLRKDIDRIKNEHEVLKVQVSKTVPFADNSKLKSLGTTIDNIGTLDGILENLGDFDGDGGGISGDYYTKQEIDTILSSYVTIGYLNTNYALKNHTHSEYLRRDEISDLDIDLTTLELVDYETNPNGVICFEQARSQGYYTKTETDSLLANKQDKLVSGTNIKTINNQSLLGSGNISIQGGGGSVIGTGSFSINSNGHLIVELPDGIDNPYYIDANGHLIYDTSV